MGMTGLRSFDQSLVTTKQWLKDLMAELSTDDEELAYHAIRAVLHALRDRMRIDDAVEFGAQLPMLLRGVYYEGWDPSDKPEKIRNLELFYEKVDKELRPRDVNPQRACIGVFRVLENHMSPGAINDLKSTLPHVLKEIWPVE